MSSNSNQLRKLRHLFRANIQRLFLEGFTAMDIADPLLSFDEQTSGEYAIEALVESDRRIAGVRRGGEVVGFVECERLEPGKSCGEQARKIPERWLVKPSAPIILLVPPLLDGSTTAIFVEQLQQPVALIGIGDLQKPAMRMWLFGMISVMEMGMTGLIEQEYPDQSWRQYMSAKRLEKAEQTRELRREAGQEATLLGCLQFGDKAQLVSRSEELRRIFSLESRRQMLKNMRETERLRNTLAHAQVISADQWQTVLQVALRFQTNLPQAEQRMREFFDRE